MIFRRPMLELVLARKKTVTRRVGVFGYKPGRVYAVQPGRGQFHVAHIQVLSVTEKMLKETTEVSAVAEGFPDLAAFRCYWIELHGSWVYRQRVKVIRFELAPRCPECKEGT